LPDRARITEIGHAKGCVVGFDLAHAAGNVELQLHDWNVDFAAWCTYKYLNSGPGAVAGCFVHERHGKNTNLPRFGGWWGNDPDTRFRMHLEPEFIPRTGADGWQISNPPIMALAPVRASMDLFDEVSMPALRQKSKRLTGYMHTLIDQYPREHYSVITPRDAHARGCQLSIQVHDRPKERFGALLDAGVVCDFREPNIIRAAPVPLYNTFRDVWRFVQILTRNR
jgi:kynureninase